MKRREFIAAVTGMCVLPGIKTSMPSTPNLDCVQEALCQVPEVSMDGGFVVPAQFYEELLSCLKDGQPVVRTSMKIDMTPRTIEEVCMLRGIPIQ